ELNPSLTTTIPFPWMDFLGLFLFITGFVIGLGAVTVIDLHAFLGRKSNYWTEATTRTHKVTKPLIWTGLILATIGGSLYYTKIGLDLAASLHLILLIILVINGAYLTFKISPYLLQREKEGKAGALLPQKMQSKVMVSFILSFLSWWSGLLLLVWHIVRAFAQ